MRYTFVSLYELVDRVLETETELFHTGPVYAGMTVKRRSATTSFQTGRATGIGAKLRTIRAARTQRQSFRRELGLGRRRAVDASDKFIIPCFTRDVGRLSPIVRFRTYGGATLHQQLRQRHIAAQGGRVQRCEVALLRRIRVRAGVQQHAADCHAALRGRAVQRLQK